MNFVFFPLLLRRLFYYNIFMSNLNIYRKIEVSTPKKYVNILNNSIQDLSHFFSEKDVKFLLNEKKIEIELKAIDIQLLKSKIDVVSKKYKLDGLSKYLTEVVKQIEKIKSYGIKGKKRIYANYNAERKVKDRKSKELKRKVYFYTEGNTYKKVNNVLFNKFINKIICGDSERILRNFPENSIDLIFTSPPYNFGLDYHSSEDGVNWELYFHKLFTIFDECIRVLKYGGRIIINIQPLFSDYIPIHHIISNHFMSKKLIWKGEILWEKNNYNCKYTAWGSWKSPSNPYLKYTWEFLEIFSKGALKKEGDSKNADITADEFKKWVVSKWSIAPERRMKEFKHPAMFPEELARRALKLFSFKNDIVLDPFNGAGTTTLVAKELGRKYVGIDVSKKYCRVALQRLKEKLF